MNMTSWLQDNIFALGAYVFAVIVWLLRGENSGKNNTEAINRLEKTVERLVEKLDIIIDRDADMRERMADHAARITNLESKL